MTFDTVGFISRVREIVSIPEVDELSDAQILDRANEVFLTKFIEDRWRTLLRRKATFPIKRFSTQIEGFLLLDDLARVYDSLTGKEDFYTVRFNSSRNLGSGFSSSSLDLEATEGVLQTSVHPLYLKVAYGQPEAQNAIYFDNTNFSFSSSQENPSLAYDEEAGAIAITDGTIGERLTASGFTSNSYSSEVLYESQRMVFPIDMRTIYQAPAVEVHGVFQPFTNGELEEFFQNPLYFERLYLITGREILYFFTQLTEADLMQRIDFQLQQNSKQLSAMARALLDKEQQQYHHRSVSAKFWQLYGYGSRKW